LKKTCNLRRLRPFTIMPVMTMVAIAATHTIMATIITP